MRKIVALTVASASLLLAGVTQAHVTLKPNEVPAGSYQRLDVRVPNETEDADTTKVVLQVPSGFVEASYEPTPGWKTTVKKSKLAKPVMNEGEKVTEEVSEITWSGGKIAPGQLPNTPGKALTFKALQTYSNGDVVRWIGAPDSESPAPQVQLTAAEPDDHHAKPEGDIAAEVSADDEHDETLAIIALIVGGLALLLSLVAVIRRKK